MHYSVKQSLEALFDLDGIINYISGRLNNKKAATDLADQYYEKLSNLRVSPGIYPLSANEELARRGYRHFSFGNYIAYYTIDDRNKVVYITRIFYKRQNYLDDFQP